MSSDSGRVSVAEEWGELVTAALLGTNRREPPRLSPGPVRDLVDDVLAEDPAHRLITSVAALVIARRAAVTPLSPAAPLQRPEVGDRPMMSPTATRIGVRAVRAWPVLEDEWLVAVIRSGQRLPPDVAVELLTRTRQDPVRRARALVAAGPISEWLIDLFPELALNATNRLPVDVDLLALGELTMTEELRELVGLDAYTFVARLQGILLGRELVAPDRKMLTNLIARARPAVLIDAADALAAMNIGFAQSLADLARSRAEMLSALDDRGTD